MTSKSDIFTQEFVLGFGFLGGLFTWVGVDPEDKIVKAFLQAAFPNNEILVALVLVLFILVSTAAGIWGTLKMAGQWGLVIVGMAWVSGLVRQLYFKSGLITREAGTRMYDLRSNSLRMFFRSQMAFLGVQRDIIEYMMGHKTDQYLDLKMKGIEYLRRPTEFQVSASLESQKTIERSFSNKWFKD